MKAVVASLAALGICFFALQAQAEGKKKKDREAEGAVLEVANKDLKNYWIPTQLSPGRSRSRIVEQVEAGFAGLEITINEQGRIGHYRILKSDLTGKSDQFVKGLVRRYRFAPGPLNEDQVPVRTTLCITVGPDSGPRKSEDAPPQWAEDAASRCATAMNARQVGPAT